MDNWLALGLLAALSYSLAAVAAKMSMSSTHGLNVSQAAVLTAAGVAIAFTLFTLYAGVPSISKLGFSLTALGLAVGFFWALGQILVYVALIRGADISRMAPIYNLNTLIVVLLGVIFLGELPDKAQALRVGVGALLITAGAVLVTV